MSSTNEAAMTLHPIPISDLGPATKDYLIAHAASGKTPAELIIELLEREAAEAGFPQPPSEPTP